MVRVGGEGVEGWEGLLGGEGSGEGLKLATVAYAGFSPQISQTCLLGSPLYLLSSWGEEKYIIRQSKEH